MRQVIRSKCGVFALAFCCLAGAASCGRSKPEIKGKLPVFPVSGQLKMRGESMGDAQIVFYPVDKLPKGASQIRPHAMTNDDGTFRVSTYGSEDGAPAGAYVVTVSWRGNLVGVSGDGDDRPEKVPTAYLRPTTSQLKVRIEEGQNTLSAWNIEGSGQQVANNPN